MIKTNILKSIQSNLIQFFRYGTVGIFANAVGYSLFLIITWFGLEPKLAVTLLFFFNTTISFLGSKRWVFSVQYNNKFDRYKAALRFFTAYLTGYFINLLMLIEFADRLGYSYQVVQIAAIALIAIYFFLILKFFVFRPTTEQS